MKTSFALAVLLAASAACAWAADESALAAKSGCLACHAVDKKVVGPSYTEVANKYRTDKAAAAKLEKKVKEGGTGVWGQIPMPPNTQVSEADVKKLVAWVLSLK